MKHFTSFLKNNDHILLRSEQGTLCLRFLSDDSFQCAYFEEQEYQNPCLQNRFLALGEETTIESLNDAFLISRKQLSLRINKQSGAISVASHQHKIDVKAYDLFNKNILGSAEKGSKVVFSAQEKEAFYGLGQQQNGFLNYAGQNVEVFHNYKAKGGESVGVPFLVSANGYGLILNTLCQTTVSFEKDIVWTADCVKDISFIMIVPEKMAGVYQNFRTIAGSIPMPLKASLGYIQCKQRYASQAEITSVARKYKEKKVPLDMLVVDWFHWAQLGDIDMDKTYWPTPETMTQEFLDMNVDTMISVWPRFMKECKNYDHLEKNGWFMKDHNGETVYGTPDDQRGALIDTTNPECGKWYWDTIHQNYGSKGFRAWWLDENEPDLWPYDFSFDAGKGYEVFNLYPYTHTKCVHDGHRKDYDQRCCILSRSAYLGAQQFGTQFWSSDVYPTWGVLEKQVPTAINFCATGMGYWSSDIGGWQALPDYHDAEMAETAELLLQTQGSTKGVVSSADYPELYVRWFQFSTFCPIFRAHGTRDENEVWSYGEEAEKILVKFLHLRYQFMPYIYSMAYRMHSEGEPMLRGLFLDYAHDERVLDIKDEYLFGSCVLVAPMLEQGQETRSVYLPKGNDWFDFWTNEKYAGGQTITAHAPLDTMPLYVKENSILPLGDAVKNTKEAQKISYHIYGAGDSSFDLYEDDGRTYQYETGAFTLRHIAFHNGALTVDGVACKAYQQI